MKKLFLILCLFSISGISHAQLVGTERLQKNQWIPSDKKVYFGDYPNASINYTGGNLVIDILQGGGRVIFPDGIDAGAGNGSFGASLVFEGETADAFETTLTVVDPTADRTITLPNQSGTVIMSSAGVVDTANAISGASNSLVWEGTTADGFETTLTVSDPTADRTLTIPNASGTALVGGNISIVAGANTACNTTCGATTRCVIGQNADASNVLVDCAAATADVCVCSAN